MTADRIGPRHALALIVAILGIMAVRWLPALAWSHTCMGEPATIVGTAGADMLQGTPGRDVIVGLDGSDTIAGGGGGDLVCAGEGDDYVRGGAGDDELYGGPGSDQIMGDQDADKVVGGPGDDKLSGGAGADHLVGMEGDDELRGGADDDQLWGSAGSDTLQGDLGTDQVHGGDGVDQCSGERTELCETGTIQAPQEAAPVQTSVDRSIPEPLTTAPIASTSGGPAVAEPTEPVSVEPAPIEADAPAEPVVFDVPDPIISDPAAPAPTPTAPAPLAGRPAGPLVPQRGVLVGGYVGARGTNGPSYHDASRRQDVLDYEAAIGRQLDIAQDFYPPHQQAWNVSRANWHIDNGRIPMITWRPGPAKPAAGGNAARDIANGAYDADIRARAQQAKQINGLFFSRLFHEMDGQYRLAYDMDGDAGAATFRALWQRVHQIFAEEGATNVVWVWSPAGFFHGDFSPAIYYPGDAYVDWIAVDPYLWIPCRSTGYRTMTQAMHQGFFDFMAAHPDKPAMLAEWGSGDMPGTDYREQFIASVGTMLAETPQVAAIVYFDSNADPVCDWELEKDPAGLDAYRTLVRDPAIVVDPTKVTSAPG